MARPLRPNPSPNPLPPSSLMAVGMLERWKIKVPPPLLMARTLTEKLFICGFPYKGIKLGSPINNACNLWLQTVKYNKYINIYINYQFHNQKTIQKFKYQPNILVNYVWRLTHSRLKRNRIHRHPDANHIPAFKRPVRLHTRGLAIVEVTIMVL